MDFEESKLVAGCKHHLRGFCKARTKCKFSHDAVICQKILTGGCNVLGCTNRHPRICRHFLLGRCFFNEKCMMLHPILPVPSGLVELEEKVLEMETSNKARAFAVRNENFYKIEILEKAIRCIEEDLEMRFMAINRKMDQAWDDIRLNYKDIKEQISSTTTFNNQFIAMNKKMEELVTKLHEVGAPTDRGRIPSTRELEEIDRALSELAECDGWPEVGVPLTGVRSPPQENWKKLTEHS